MGKYARHDVVPTSNDKWGEFLKHGHICILIYAGVFLHAVNIFITATAIPSIINEIGGGDLLNWVTTIYVLMTIITSLVGSPIFNSIGAKKLLITTSFIYALGNIVCLVADTMMVFLLGRLVQGIGAGGLIFVSYSLIGTSLPEILRAKAFALVGCVWSAAMIVGPSIGGLLSEYTSWRAAFAFLVVATVLYLVSVVFSQLRLDNRANGDGISNSFQMMLFTTGIMFCVTLIMLSNRAEDLLIGVFVAAFALGALYLMITIYRRERFGFLHPEILRFNSKIGLASWILLLLSISTYSFSVYGTVLTQNIFGLSATMAGYLVGGYALSMTFGEVVISNVPKSIRDSMLTASQILILVSLCGIGLSLKGESLPWLILSVTFAGIGCGFSWTTVSEVISQSTSGQPGHSAASSIPSIQMLGVSVGTALYGSIASTFKFNEGSTMEITKEFSFWIHVLPAIVVCLAAVAAFRVSTLRKMSKGSTIESIVRQHTKDIGEGSQHRAHNFLIK